MAIAERRSVEACLCHLRAWCRYSVRSGLNPDRYQKATTEQSVVAFFVSRTKCCLHGYCIRWRIVQRFKGNWFSEHSPALGRNITNDNVHGDAFLRRNTRMFSDGLSEACDQLFPGVSTQSACNNIGLQSND